MKKKRGPLNEPEDGQFTQPSKKDIERGLYTMTRCPETHPHFGTCTQRGSHFLHRNDLAAWTDNAAKAVREGRPEDQIVNGTQAGVACPGCMIGIPLGTGLHDAKKGCKLL